MDLQGRSSKRGTLDTPENEADLREISDASPLVEHSLYRFLSVFLMDALRPACTDALEELLF